MIRAPQDRVFQALSDYDLLADFSPRIDESRVIGPDEQGRELVYTLIEGCMAFFCRRIERVSQLEPWAPDRVLVTLLDGHGSLNSAVEEWKLSPADTATRVRYTMVSEANFWIPPLLGTWLIRRTLRRSSVEAAEALEVWANSEI